jgi:hypothetical protein
MRSITWCEIWSSRKASHAFVNTCPRCSPKVPVVHHLAEIAPSEILRSNIEVADSAIAPAHRIAAMDLRVEAEEQDPVLIGNSNLGSICSRESIRQFARRIADRP